MLLMTITPKPYEGGTFYIQIQFCSLTQCLSPSFCQLTLQRFTCQTVGPHTLVRVSSTLSSSRVSRCSQTCTENACLTPRQTPTSQPGLLCGHLNCRRHFKRSSTDTNESFFSKLHLSLIFTNVEKLPCFPQNIESCWIRPLKKKKRLKPRLCYHTETNRNPVNTES